MWKDLTIAPSSVEVTPLTRSISKANFGMRNADFEKPRPRNVEKPHYNSIIGKSDAVHKECENPFSPITRPQRNKKTASNPPGAAGSGASDRLRRETRKPVVVRGVPVRGGNNILVEFIYVDSEKEFSHSG